MSTLKADTIQNTSGGAVTLTNQYAAKSYINFDNDGTSIFKSVNVSSLSDDGTADYAFTMTNALTDANHVVSLGFHSAGKNPRLVNVAPDTSVTTTYLPLEGMTTTTGAADESGITDICILINGDLA